MLADRERSSSSSAYPTATSAFSSSGQQQQPPSHSNSLPPTSTTTNGSSGKPTSISLPSYHSRRSSLITLAQLPASTPSSNLPLTGNGSGRPYASTPVSEHPPPLLYSQYSSGSITSSASSGSNVGAHAADGSISEGWPSQYRHQSNGSNGNDYLGGGGSASNSIPLPSGGTGGRRNSDSPVELLRSPPLSSSPPPMPPPPHPHAYPSHSYSSYNSNTSSSSNPDAALPPLPQPSPDLPNPSSQDSQSQQPQPFFANQAHLTTTNTSTTPVGSPLNDGYTYSPPPVNGYPTSPLSTNTTEDDTTGRVIGGVGAGLGLGSIAEGFSHHAISSGSGGGGMTGMGVGTDKKRSLSGHEDVSSHHGHSQVGHEYHHQNVPQHHQREDLVDVGFDEGVLKTLCDLDCGMPLLLERMKQGMASARETSNFFKKRAVIEEEYARSLIKLSRSSSDSYSLSEGKAGSYVTNWQAFLKTHELLADNRLKLAAQLNDMSDELATLAKEAEKNRKSSKEMSGRLERGLSEQDGLVDKARNRFDSAAEELEKLLLIKQGESIKDNATLSHSYTSANPVSPSSISTLSSNSGGANSKRTFGKAMSKLKGPKTVAQVAKMEDEVRSKMGQSSDSYRSQVLGAQAVRNEYFNLQLPRMLRSLKENVDEVDLGTQYHLSRYCYLHESTTINDGLTIAPLSSDDGPGLKPIIEGMDIREDFKTFLQQFALSWQMSGQKGPKRDSPADDGFGAPRPQISPRHSISNMHQQFSAPPQRPTFGVDLGEQMLRDSVEVPRVLEKCCEAIELHGLESMGIYRLSGTTSRVQRLKAKLDRDIEGTDLLSEENLTDINDIAAVMKLWFREMPEPLLTWENYHGFIEAAKIENDRLRHIRLHERVNELPDPNYATLKYLMGHLDKVKAREHVNQMSCSNLAIVFGPNLLGAPPREPGAQGTALADMSWQCKCIETILQHYVEIFVDTES